MAKTIKVLIADDHAIVRTGLRALIETDPGMKLAGEAENGAEAVKKALELQPDVILMDLLMPQKDGIEAIGDIRRINPDACILVLTSFADSDRIVPAVKSGALGYILKDSHPNDLLCAIRDVYDGRVYFHPTIARQLLHNSERLLASEPLPDELLTDRQLDVLKLVARGMSNEEIADQLVISKRTVGVHISHILEKLALENRTQAALYAIRAGLTGLYDS